ncbi:MULTISPECIES: CatB-related O-acetyltransferase [unclassified Acinetobacter]|uniref:CatB-related O-acetyltransferase n=1 Tax=unclassified Acinetobacter TaxID=196816 RepID=UPI0022ABD7C8|nr:MULTISPECIES: CatB-related O-acetyltransferase [unclassified Acinetobacter]WAU73660.1 CatB-related O-acetyltransferase [Acinetobacter sp. TR11]WAU76560.1 CatB-related O-acetyltransferase [Acinetobacter sp. TR3]
MNKPHWSQVEYLHQTVKNPNIHIKGTTSYYSHAWSDSFEQSVVRYLYGDEYSLKAWEPLWEIDQLHIGSYVCIAAEAVILMGGNHTHRTDWFSLYPFMEHIVDAYQMKGDTIIGDGAWIGMRAMIMPGINIGEGAIVASGSIVTKDVEPYSIVAGNPAQKVKMRFSNEVIQELLNLKLYDLEPEKFNQLIPYLVQSDINLLKERYYHLVND